MNTEETQQDGNRWRECTTVVSARQRQEVSGRGQIGEGRMQRKPQLRSMRLRDVSRGSVRYVGQGRCFSLCSRVCSSWCRNNILFHGYCLIPTWSRVSGTDEGTHGFHEECLRMAGADGTSLLHCGRSTITKPGLEGFKHITVPIKCQAKKHSLGCFYRIICACRVVIEQISSCLVRGWGMPEAEEQTLCLHVQAMQLRGMLRWGGVHLGPNDG